MAFIYDIFDGWDRGKKGRKFLIQHSPSIAIILILPFPKTASKQKRKTERRTSILPYPPPPSSPSSPPYPAHNSHHPYPPPPKTKPPHPAPFPPTSQQTRYTANSTSFLTLPGYIPSLPPSPLPTSNQTNRTTTCLHSYQTQQSITSETNTHTSRHPAQIHDPHSISAPTSSAYRGAPTYMGGCGAERPTAGIAVRW